MRIIAALLALILLVPGAMAEEGKNAPKRKKRPPAPPGVHWESDFEKGMARAEREGLPVLFAVNALENENANNLLATRLYRSKDWGEATRGYVAFVCNPKQHGSTAAGACGRYPGSTCAQHMKALRWFLGRFGQDLISPQHVILEPDGDVAYRKQYYTSVVGPSLLDTYLSFIAPQAAYAQAAMKRTAQIKRLSKIPVAELEQAAKPLLSGMDGLGAATLLNVLDDTYEAPRRLAVLRVLRHAPRLQVPVLALAAEERVFFPGEAAAETLLWIEALFAVDRAYGVWAATRALVRMEKEAERSAVMRIWAAREVAGSKSVGTDPGIKDVPKDERAHAYEALLLAGDRRAHVSHIPRAWTRGRAREIMRARTLTPGSRPVPAGTLKAALLEGHPRRLRPLILSADMPEVRRNLDGLIDALAKSLSYRIRVAAALRLLEAQQPQGGAIVKLLSVALDDSIEGPATRALAVRILGKDPGRDQEEWRLALIAHVQGGTK